MIACFFEDWIRAASRRRCSAFLCLQCEHAHVCNAKLYLRKMSSATIIVTLQVLSFVGQDFNLLYMLSSQTALKQQQQVHHNERQGNR